MKTPFRLLLLLAPLLSGVTIVDGGRSPMLRRNKTRGPRPLDMTCIIDETHDEPTEMRMYDFKYYYAMGFVNQVDEDEMQQLEQNIFEAIRDRILWCYEEKRKLRVEASSAMQYNSRQLRELGIVAFTMGKMDTDTPCKSDVCLSL